MKLHPILLAALLLGISSITHAEEPSATQDATLDRLAKVEFFAFGGVYEAGSISQGEKDFTEILSRPTALADFQKLLKTGNAPAKCYALVGIYYLDPKVYKTLAPSRIFNWTQLKTMDGCCIENSSMGSILGKIEDGIYPKHITESKVHSLPTKTQGQ